MNILVLMPGPQVAEYSYSATGLGEPLLTGITGDCRGRSEAMIALTGVLQKVREASGRTGAALDAVALRVVAGGAAFRSPAVVSPEVVRRLEGLVPQAPLHMPTALTLIRCCEEVLAEAPVVLVFETSFFADLPLREGLYALEAGLMRRPDLQRYGFHGLFHEAACEHVARARKAHRIFSICLEPRPEAAAAIGGRAVMVTSGATPLEGIPGETTCGELDPRIVLTLAEKMGWGPEQINEILTRESGILGLTGEPATMEAVFRSERPPYRFARELIQYRLLQACGAGIAAMSGLDAMVFSGRYAGVGEMLGPWLMSALGPHLRQRGCDLSWECFGEPLDRIIADRAAAALLGSGRHRTRLERAPVGR